MPMSMLGPWECRCRRAAIGFFRSFYTWSEENNGFFTLLQIIVATMRHTSRRLRQFTLGLLVLVAVGHANLACDLTGRAPNTSGITRLGRDLLRKSFAEPCDRPSQTDPFLQVIYRL
jgi:hypothetical protein